ncbi:hypothetical protein [Blastococcus xanthinilyticus]|uniref:Uncharacterized protein n=1 Tax=Blastococcus xanthinilyticus TaxID=1564164 RepID=A0A5S5CU37_9ACTN|nr:hypothetical protein [Blastococcus xanthinilyticus]TYP87125.1 hypothetical protein BD833_10760 [Blastococcus xanthinilyticus]
MNDGDTTLISARLDDLADQLAPGFDPRAHALGARDRYRQQRRTRLGTAAVAAVVVAVGIGVPTALGALTASPGGGVAGPGTAGTEAVPEDSAARSAAEDARRAREAEDRATAAAEEAAAVEMVAGVLGARTPPLELRAGADRACPDVAAGLIAALGGGTRPTTGTDLTGGCRWSTPGPALTLSLVPGQTEDQMVGEVDRSVAAEGCTVRVMPSAVDVTPLTVCPAGTGTTWTLRVPDSGGAGYWVLSAEDAPTAEAGSGGLLALVDVVDAGW